ncbi:MAG: murein hydrolase activator EnvC [Gammaproteobacteria bacterium]
MAVGATAPVFADPSQDRELKALRAKIDKVRGEMQRDVKRRDAQSDKLREIESRIQDLGKNIVRLKDERRAGETRLAALTQQERERAAALDDDKSTLALEVRTAFMNGGQEQLKLLLNQRDPAQLGRMSVYYQMFAEHRADNIRAVVDKLEALRETTRQVAVQTQRIADLQTQRETERSALQAARTERQTLVAQIAKKIAAGESEVTRLEREEKRLESLIAELQQLLKEYPVASRDAFPKLKGKLAWPLTGRLLADFGQPRAGQKLKWNGVLVAAERGTPVRAIARGRVAYAEWLPGLGLLTVLEHSDGYISLYGHNETLAKQSGEWVDAGDELATVGDSGGQPQSALYFEIRRGRNPQNPHPWFKSTVSAR